MATKGLKGFSTKNVIILVVTVTGTGPYPNYIQINNWLGFHPLYFPLVSSTINRGCQPRTVGQVGGRFVQKKPGVSEGFFVSSWLIL